VQKRTKLAEHVQFNNNDNFAKNDHLRKKHATKWRGVDKK